MPFEVFKVHKANNNKENDKKYDCKNNMPFTYTHPINPIICYTIENPLQS